jgi:hypothetical protein|eukprot:COSAG01_NODE_3668_length_5811_cov_52.307598_4_plen_66_part_00
MCARCVGSFQSLSRCSPPHGLTSLLYGSTCSATEVWRLNIIKNVADSGLLCQSILMINLLMFRRW